MGAAKPLSVFFNLKDLKENSRVRKPFLHAGMLMERFYRTNAYQEYKRSENRLEAIKTSIKKDLMNIDDKRIEYKECGYVAKWITVPVYQVDQVGLNQYLHEHYGLFLPCATIPTKGLTDEEKKELQPFVIYGEPKIGIHPNKKGRVADHDDTDWDQMDVSRKVVLYAREQQEFDKLKQSYQSLKRKFLDCPILKKQGKITHEFGSITRKEQIAGYNLEGIKEWYGIDYLIEHGKCDTDILDEFIVKGYIKKEEINQFRVEIDRQVRFILQSFESEQRSIENMNRKLERIVAMQTKR